MSLQGRGGAFFLGGVPSILAKVSLAFSLDFCHLDVPSVLDNHFLFKDSSVPTSHTTMVFNVIEKNCFSG